MAITEDASMNGSTDFLGVAEKGEMIMSTKSKIAALAAVAIVIAAPRLRVSGSSPLTTALSPARSPLPPIPEARTPTGFSGLRTTT
jgi:hypothetical protein